VVFTRQLATLIKAGLTISQALHSTVSQISNKKLQAIIFRLNKAVDGGTQLSDALAEYPDSFDKIYISMVQSGEASGKLEESLLRLANQLEKEADIQSKIRGALIYPAVVMVVILLVMGYMMSSVVPQIAELYKSFNKELPLLTQIITSASDIITRFWFAIIPALAGLVYGIYKYMKSPPGRRFMDRMKLTMPPTNQLFLKMYMGRFARTLGSLTSSGIQILESLQLVGESMNNTLLLNEITVVAQEVKSGHAMSTSLERTEYFLPLVGQMVKVGEDSGTMGEMLDRLASFYENEVDQQVKNISTLIEPILIVFMGIMVIIIILGILYPVYTLVGGGLG
jgi:type II secretory pathway component PulF